MSISRERFVEITPKIFLPLRRILLKDIEYICIDTICTVTLIEVNTYE